MNREQIIQLAREAQMPFDWRSGEITYLDRLERFAALVAKAERERLADQIDRMPFGDTAASFSIWVRDQTKAWDWPGREQL